MTDASDARGEVAAALAGLVAEFGIHRLTTRESVSAILADRLGSSGPSARKEVGLVAAAAGEGVVGELMGGDTVVAVAERFAAATDLTDEAASWAVNAWADAIGDRAATIPDADATHRYQHRPDEPVDEEAPERPRRRTAVWIAAAVVMVAALAAGAAATGILDDEDLALRSAYVGRCFSEIEIRGSQMYARDRDCADAPRYMGLGYVSDFGEEAGLEQCDLATVATFPELWAQGDAEPVVMDGRCFAELTGVDRAPTDQLQRARDVTVGDCVVTLPSFASLWVVPQGCEGPRYEVVGVEGSDCATGQSVIHRDSSTNYCVEPVF